MSANTQTNPRRTPAASGARLGATRSATEVSKPMLLFFYSPTSGRSRRAEGYLAQVLQRRQNHDTFTRHRIDFELRRDLAARCGVERSPAIVVVAGRRVRCRLEQPRSCPEIQSLLGPWLK